MKSKSLTLTIVIPVYNEQRYLKACLDAIAAQSEMPDEVIVVDNNSTDDSAMVAVSYPFVKLLLEPRQHQVFAQHTGFNAAKGDIIGRIDADTILRPGWVKKIKRAFQADADLAAVTGLADPYDAYLRKISLFVIDSYFAIAEALAGHTLLWGTNLALRSDQWQKVADKVRLQGDIWEDYDLAFCLSRWGDGDIVRRKDIEVGASFRAIHKNLFRQIRYNLRAPRTFYYRKGPFAAVVFVLLLTLPSLIALYPLTVLDFIVGKLRGLQDAPK